MLDDLMKQLAKDLELQLEDLKTEVPNIYAMPLENDINIIIKTHLPVGISLSGVLGKSPSANLEEFYTELLWANLFGQSTRGALLGLNEDGNQLTLSQIIDYNVNYKEFNEILEDFINVADFWQNEAITFKK